MDGKRIMHIDLNRLSLEDILQALGELDPSILFLDLYWSWDRRGQKTADDLVHILGALPHTLKSLRLSGNGLVNESPDALVRILGALSATLQALVLREKKLGHKADAELIRILAMLPVNLRSLDLSENNFGRKLPLSSCKSSAHCP